jgi:ribonuclease M5
MRINELIVVEGVHDVAALKQIVEADIVITQGLHQDEALVDLLREAVKTRGVIVFTDPDHPGETIRRRISEAVPGVKHAYLNAKSARSKRKVGIEHASPEVLLEALSHVMTVSSTLSDLTRNDLYELHLSGHPNSHVLRCRLAEVLHLPDVNAKQLLVQLRTRGYSRAQLEQLLTEKII